MNVNVFRYVHSESQCQIREICYDIDAYEMSFNIYLEWAFYLELLPLVL